MEDADTAQEQVDPTRKYFPFWLPEGGYQEIDANEVMPAFTHGDIVIRGGKVGATFSIGQQAGVCFVVKCWVFKTKNRPNLSAVKFKSIERNCGWDPTVNPEVGTEFGKLLFYKEAHLSPYVNHSFTVETRLKCQKIDKADFADNMGAQIVYVVQVVNLGNDTSRPIGITKYHNLSFCAV